MSKEEIPSWYASYALLVIFFANFFNYMDRMLVSAALEYIKKDLKLAGWQEGALWSAFTIGYLCSAPFVGLLADRYKRTIIFSACVLIWSFATAGCGISQNFTQMLLFRVIIGLGEAGCLIIGPVLISDYFKKSMRGRALAIFTIGLPAGAIAGYVVGGILTQHIIWRRLFLITGVSGVVVAFLLAFLREPIRGMHDNNLAGHKLSLPGGVAYLNFLKNIPLVFVTLALTTAAFVIGPLVHFSFKYFTIAKFFPAEFVTIGLAIAMITGILGSIAGGYAGDMFARKNPASYTIVAGIGFCIAVPFVIASTITTTKALLLGAIFPAFLFIYAAMPTLNTQIANLVSPYQRAAAFSFVIFVMHLFGDTISPIIFGISYDKNPYLTFAYFPLILLISSICCFIAAILIMRSNYRLSRP